MHYFPTLPSTLEVSEQLPVDGHFCSDCRTQRHLRKDLIHVAGQKDTCQWIILHNGFELIEKFFQTVRLLNSSIEITFDEEELQSAVSETSAISIAFQGEPGAFSFSAARKFFSPEIHVQPFEQFRQVFEALAAGVVTHAVIPIENSLYGSIHENYDNILQHGFKISGETTIRIAHQLITRPGTSFGDIRRVFSHPVALDQCRQFFREFPHLTPVSFYDTAGSVKMLMQKQLPDAAAIASETAAEIYSGLILKNNIEDNENNFTRFFLLTKQMQNAEEFRSADFWKTSLVFATANAPGALFKAMACFALRDINLTKIESRPIREKPWEYLFYVDITGCIKDRNVRKAIHHLGELTSFLKVLGSYRPTA